MAGSPQAPVDALRRAPGRHHRSALHEHARELSGYALASGGADVPAGDRDRGDPGDHRALPSLEPGPLGDPAQAARLGRRGGRAVRVRVVFPGLPRRAARRDGPGTPGLLSRHLGSHPGRPGRLAATAPGRHSRGTPRLAAGRGHDPRRTGGTAPPSMPCGSSSRRPFMQPRSCCCQGAQEAERHQHAVGRSEGQRTSGHRHAEQYQRAGEPGEERDDAEPEDRQTSPLESGRFRQAHPICTFASSLIRCGDQRGSCVSSTYTS